MGFSRNVQPQIDAFIQELLDRGRKRVAVNYKSQLSYFLSFMASQRKHIDYVSEIGRRDIERFTEYLWKVEYGANRRSNHLYRNSFVYRVLKATYDFFEYLTSREDTVDQRHLPTPGLFLGSDFPSPNKRGVKHFPRWLEKLLHQHILNLPEENESFVPLPWPKNLRRKPHELDSLRFKVIMLLLYHVGARIKDACTLEADCLIEKYGAPWLKIFSNKTKRHYDIPITPELARALSRYMSRSSGERRKHPTLHRDANFLFWIDLDRDFPHFLRTTAERVRDFNRLVLEKSKESGHPVQDVAELNLTSHKYRHTVAIRLVRLGADPMLIAEFFGHTDLTMAQAYIQESQQEIDELMEELWDDDSLDLSEDIVDNFNFSRDDLYGTSGVISKVECGHCAHLGDKPPCGEEAYGCWLCEKLEPDHEDPDYPERLNEMLVNHQALRDRNIHLGHMGAAKVEQEVITRIQEFMGMLSAEGSA